MMKSIHRYLAVALVAGGLALAPSVWAGECCKKASADVKAGKTCEKCLTHKCCKDAAKKVAEADKAKSCAKCAAKAEGEKKKS